MDRTRSTRSRLAATLLAVALPAAALHGAGPDTPAEDLHVQVATIFDQAVYLDNLTPHESVVEGNRERIGDEEEFQKWLEVQRSRILRDLVFKLLSNAYMQENGITVSEQEIDEFLRKEKEVYNKVLEKYAKDLYALQTQAERIHAEGKTVPPELFEQIELMKKKIDVLERKNVDRMVISKKQRQLHDEVERQRVSNAIRAWKFNRLLHDQFGGRVTTQKNNLSYVPYEAYAAWLQTQHDLGHFTITDEQLNADFWVYYNREPENTMEPFPGMWDQLRWADSNLP